MKTLAVLLLAAALAGCTTSGFRKYYQPLSSAPLPAQAAFLAENAAPQLLRTAPEALADTVQSYRDKGYALLGTAAFNGPDEPQKNALAQAKRLRATLVVLTSRYTGTQTDIVPVTVPTSDFVPIHGSVMVGGQLTPFRGHHAVYGSMVMPMVMQVRRFDHVAAFLVKLNEVPPSGLVLTGLTPALRKLHERNTGAVVEVVLEDSPAFRADLLEGDLIVAVDGRAVSTPAQAEAALEAARQRGGTVQLTLIRDKKTRELPLAL